ncbi:MAG: BamA/OMP85 family outer membrane protein [Planctomycetaceae bacterium]
MRRTATFFLPALAILLLAGLARGAGERKVVGIRFEGNRRYTGEFLQEQIATKVGEPLDPALLSRDERTLREYFSAVLEIEEITTDGGVEVVFHVVDKSVVGAVEVLGLAGVRNEDFEALLLTRRGRPLQEFALRSDKDLLERLHREKGYAFADVQWYRRRTDQPDVEDIIFQVFPERRVKVREVILDGAASLRRAKLLAGASNSDRYRSQLFGFLAPSWFDRAALEEDRRRIELIYHAEGFLDARVVLVEVRHDDARRYATIRYQVAEGTRYVLEGIRLEWGAEADAQPLEADREFLSPAEAERIAAPFVGEAYREEDLGRAYREIELRFFSRAYADVALSLFPQPDPVRHTVLVRLTARAGPKVRLGRIRIVGNQWTRDNVLRREFREGAMPGDLLDVEALEQGLNRIQSLNFFSVARFWPPRYGLSKSANLDRPDEFDVELEVEETDTRQFNVGAGVTSDGGVFGNFTVTWRNFDYRKPPSRPWAIFDQDAFRGAGQFFELSAAPGTTFSSFRLTFSDPAVNDSRWSFGFSLFRNLAFLEDYDQASTGGYIRVGRFLDERMRWQLSFEWMLREVTLDNPDPPSPVNALDAQGHNSVHGIGITIRYDRRTEVGRHLTGHQSSLRVDLLGGLFGGDTHVVKVALDHSRGWRMLQLRSGNFHRVTVHASLDWAGAYGDSPEVPIFERYFAGGRTLRGFEFREVGPRSNGRPTGGEFLALVTVNYFIPLTPPEGQFGLDLVFFLDQGTLNTTLGEFEAEDWRISVGFGVAIAFGGPTQPPLQIDFGFPLSEGAGDRKQAVSFSFSRNF